MQKYTNQAKADIKSGKSPAPYPSAFDKVHSAKISDGMEKSDYYKSFGDLYIMTVKNYASSTPENRVETYNNMVAACLACHSQHCPGPVPVIKKMKWEVNWIFSKYSDYKIEYNQYQQHPCQPSVSGWLIRELITAYRANFTLWINLHSARRTFNFFHELLTS